MVDSFLLENPEISVELTLDDRVVNLVEEGFDVAIRIRALADSSLTARRLATARMALCAAPAYLARRAAPRHPRDLARHDCLVYDYMARQGVWFFTREGAAEDVRVGGRLHGNNGDVLVQAAVDGLGVVMTRARGDPQRRACPDFAGLARGGARALRRHAAGPGRCAESARPGAKATVTAGR